MFFQLLFPHIHIKIPLIDKKKKGKHKLNQIQLSLRTRTFQMLSGTIGKKMSVSTAINNNYFRIMQMQWKRLPRKKRADATWFFHKALQRARTKMALWFFEQSTTITISEYSARCAVEGGNIDLFQLCLTILIQFTVDGAIACPASQQTCIHACIHAETLVDTLNLELTIVKHNRIAMFNLLTEKIIDIPHLPLSFYQCAEMALKQNQFKMFKVINTYARFSPRELLWMIRQLKYPEQERFRKLLCQMIRKQRNQSSYRTKTKRKPNSI